MPRSGRAAIIIRRTVWTASSAVLMAVLSAGTSSSDISTDGQWVAVPPPLGRFGATATFDPLHDRMIVYGSSFAPGDPSLWSVTLDDDPKWSAISAVGEGPSPSEQHSAIYDPLRQRILIFGGSGGGELPDPRSVVWSLSLSGVPTWSVIHATGPAPSSRYGHTAVYDAANDRMLIYGGRSGRSLCGDVWALSLTGVPTWTQLVSPGVGPAARMGHVALYDSFRNRMIVYGGTIQGDVWELTLSDTPQWAQLFPSGVAPSPRGSASGVFDERRDRLLVFGGVVSSLTNECWSLSLDGSERWEQILPTGPAPTPRDGHASILDPNRDRMLVFGGISQDLKENDLWSLSLESPAWAQLIKSSELPWSAAANHSAILDPIRDRMIVFGGAEYGSFGPVGTNATYVFTSGDRGEWKYVSPTGPQPPPRYAHTAVYDPLRDRMVVCAGRSGPYAGYGDLWVTSLSDSVQNWNQLPGSLVSDRSDHTAIYDPGGDRVIVFGGFYVHGNFALNSTSEWTFTRGSWSGLATMGIRPSARYGHTAIYDGPRQRMIVFGGRNPFGYQNDTWSLSLTGTPAWTQLAPSGSPPPARSGHTAVYDPVRNRMVVYGGADASTEFGDVWAMSLTDSPTWTQLAPAGTSPGPRREHSACYDPLRDRMVVFGGWQGSNAYPQTWALDWATVSGVPDAFSSATRSGITFMHPNPARGPVSLELTVVAGQIPDEIEVTDVQGRRVWATAVRGLGPGVHRITFDPRETKVRAIRTGIYFVHLVGRPGPSRKLVVLD